nr:hypothetical protein CFP56_78969 [Quercus suber]
MIIAMKVSLRWWGRLLGGCGEATVDVPKHSDSLVQHWIPTSGHMYKVNVDGTIFKAQKEFGVGVIICDANGLVVATLSKKFQAPWGPLEVEAKAQFAKDVGLLEFILEGNSLNVFRALASLSPLSALVMPIIYGIQASCHDVN